MKPRALALGLATLAAPLLAAPAQAQQSPAQLSFGIAHFDQHWLDPNAGFLDSSESDDRFETVDFRAEYRYAPVWTYGGWAGLRPFVGIEATADAAVYGLGGVALDLKLGPVIVTPSFGAGLYHDGDGKDLGSILEFRSMIEVGYEFTSGYRVSVQFSHISNGGITDTNPGANVVGAYLHVPFSALTGI
ncbi:acyloxyacyl hydrolase [Arenibaculum pallidiluteum]|uniref:acyloxyacyl hydrolase n=1 Tax=Arenibaculum pallidiluteum TaxID=2812559 RepID=UPI001A965EE6|nr:acyloxyacyl hydrolase [Arenibaculum pallidiluteum]